MENKEKGKVGKNLQRKLSRDTFEDLCKLMCSEEEIAGFFHVSKMSLEKWCKETYGRAFSECFLEFCSDGKISLRRIQWDLAKNNASMAIFLGKNYLNQRDVVDSNVNEKVSIVSDMPFMDSSSNSCSNSEEDE